VSLPAAKPGTDADGDVCLGGRGQRDQRNYGERCGEGDDDIYGGDGEEQMAGAAGEDVLYGGNGNDKLDGLDDSIGLPVGPTVRDELYCGPGKDHYAADRLDYVDSSCEEKVK
jgi:Ca2+-binding RTX toxin-like protein